MALTTCTECKREISDRAKACPHCGHSAPRKGLPWYAWVVLVPIGVLSAMAVIGSFLPGPSPEQLAAEKRECTQALMSNMDASTRTYTDKQAYDAVVREKCSGFSINGKPVAP